MAEATAEQAKTEQTSEQKTEVKTEGKTFTQEDVDRIVQDRISRERTKYENYDDLVKFKTEHEKSQEIKNQQELEAQKKYEEAKAEYEKKIQERDSLITQKDQALKDSQVNHALSTEISKQGGYTEEVMAVIRSSVVFAENGDIRIKGKDANGIDIDLPITEGVKKFLEERPYLVRAEARSGGGTSPGNTGEGGSGLTDDLMQLNEQYLKAYTSGDHKTAKELRAKITAHPKMGNRQV